MFGESLNGSGFLGYNGFPITLNYFTALPDTAQLQDGNATIIFKSLLKKDAITREKSLNDLLQYIDSSESGSPGPGSASLIDDIFMMSWLQIYPKLAIDNSRNVRVLANQAQGKLLEKLGGRSFSKYLKSCIPVWLLGTFDSDNSVSSGTYKTLLSSFQNDKDRVDSKIWVLFNDSILNFVNTVINMETPDSLSDTRYTKVDDSVAKYERVLNGALSMLVRIITIYNSNKESPNAESVAQIEAIVQNETLWDRLAPCLESETLNLTLFKTLLALMKVLFGGAADPASGAGTASFVAGQFESMGSLYKLVSKKFLKHVKFRQPKTSSSSVIYSTIILQFWDTLIALTKYSQLEGVKAKKNFWEYGSSESKTSERLMGYLKLGHCQSSPMYYAIVSQFFVVLTTQIDQGTKGSVQFLVEGEKNGKHILNAIGVFSATTSTPEFREKSLASVLKVWSLLSSFIGAKSTSLLRNIIHQVIDSPPFRGRSTTTLEKVLADFLNSQKGLDLDALLQPISDSIVSISVESKEDIEFPSKTNDAAIFVDTYTQLLADVSISLLQSLIHRIITESEDLTHPKLAFGILAKSIPKYLSSKDANTDDEILQFLESVPSYVEADFIEQPLSVLAATTKICPSETIEDFFVKLSSCAPNEVPKFLVSIMEQVDLTQIPEIMDYVRSISSKHGDLSSYENKLIFKYLEHDSDSDILNNLHARAKNSDEDGVKFIDALAKSGKNVEEAVPNADLGLIHRMCWKNIGSNSSREVLKKIDGGRQSLLDYILDGKPDSTANIVTFITESKDIFEQYFPYSEIVALVNNSTLEQTNLLSMANPLEQNIYLAQSASTSEVDEGANFDDLGKFLLSINKVFTNDNKLVVCIGLVAEYLADFIFLRKRSAAKSSDQHEDVENEHAQELDEITVLQMDLSETFETRSASDIQVVFRSLVGEENIENDSLLSLVNSSPSNYFSRLLKRILTSTLERASIQEFEANFPSPPLDLTKLATTSPLKLAIILMACNKFFNLTTKFDRIRNYAVAEILGVRSESKILVDGLKWLSLSINFLNIESEGKKSELIPPHRLVMVINTFTSWLDSSIAYDEEFIAVRCLLARFLTGYLNTVANSDTPEKLFDLGMQLVQDNLSTSQTEPKRVELRYFTLKLFSALDSKKTWFKELWDETLPSLSEEILETILNEDIREQDKSLNNQPVLLYFELLLRAAPKLKIPSSVLKERIDELYSLLQSEFIHLQGIAIYFLHPLILEIQQDFVVEYQLQKKAKISESGDDDEDGKIDAKIPEVLLSIIEAPLEEHYMEFESPFRVSQYAKAWYLVFDHFEDITYSIRNKYTEELKQTNCIPKLLDYIFQQVDVTNEKLISKIAEVDMISLAKITIEGQQFLDEMKLTLIYLYYLSLVHFGSEVSQWFNGIRDRQLKLKIEKFTTKHVSPLIISQILEDVSKSVKKGVAGDDDIMTVKVNKSTNEIKSVYAIDDQTMEMVVKIPPLYPLHKVSVEGPLRLGVKDNQWKAWLLASQRVISLTNGSIIEAIELFNKNVSLHFSGFEDCAICYSILHQDHSLPSKTCPVCHNKFHAACLYKWFKSSGSSTCPLCRSTFNFTRRS